MTKYVDGACRPQSNFHTENTQSNEMLRKTIGSFVNADKEATKWHIDKMALKIKSDKNNGSIIIKTFYW